MSDKVFDVIVIGSGLGGLRSTQELLKNNLKVCMITSKEFCSGSSFYPGTWGLGMIGPKNENDKKDLLENILKVGCNRSNPKLSSILVDKVNDELDLLLKEGINLKRSVDPEGVIPCFDSNKRRWLGFDFSSAKKSFSKMLDNKNLTVFCKTKVINIYNINDNSKGILVENSNGSLELLKSKSIIIASGGYTCLFQHNFSLELNSPIIQYLAYKNGCELINLDLIQFIPAYVNPLYKTVFNERVFNYIILKDKYGNNILKDLPSIDELLKERSTYGPFTNRLKSNIIDKKIFEYYKKDNDSVYFEYPKNIENIDDTLIYNYFKWLKESNKNIKDKIHIAPFAHACNGGLKIDENASTTVNGIFACGEVTGGVHGADRIGGLSTCNALVFGAIAGKSASKYCNTHKFEDFNIDIPSTIKTTEEDIDKFNNILFNIRKTLYLEASILKDSKSIINAKKTINSLMEEFKDVKLSVVNNSTLESYLNFSLLYLDSIK